MRRKPQPVDQVKCAEIAAACACFNFRKAARVVTQFFDSVLHRCGLRSTQFVILVGVRLCEPISMGKLATELVTDRSTLTRNLRPLLKLRLVRHAPMKGRRAKCLMMTAAGQRLLDRAVPLWEQAQGRFVRALGKSRWRELLAHLSATVSVTRSA